MPPTKRPKPAAVSTVRKFDTITTVTAAGACTTVLRLFSADGESIELGLSNPTSNIIVVRRHGRVFLCSAHCNPACFNENGFCIQENTIGVSLPSLVSVYTNLEAFDARHFSSPAGWNAWFKITAGDPIRIRLYMRSPFVLTPMQTFEQELELQEFLQ
jgi:hypothetical protein